MLAKEGVDEQVEGNGATTFRCSQNGHCGGGDAGPGGVDVNQADRGTTTFRAVKMATMRWCRCCWPEGVDEQANIRGATTFHCGQNGHSEIVSMLLAKEGVDVNRPRILVISTLPSVKMATVRWCRCCWPRRVSM